MPGQSFLQRFDTERGLHRDGHAPRQHTPETPFWAPPRQVIHRAARKARGLGLLRDAQRMPAVDHRFAFSNPALLSAPSKKSFSSVSSPIFACSAFTSTLGDAGAALPPPPKTSEAPLSSCAFQAVIWFG